MARDVKEHAKDKDGWEKNVQKLGDEYANVKDAIKHSGDSHDPLTNAAVEATRASPYLMGHVLVIGGVILIGIILALAAIG